MSATKSCGCGPEAPCADHSGDDSPTCCEQAASTALLALAAELDRVANGHDSALLAHAYREAAELARSRAHASATEPVTLEAAPHEYLSTSCLHGDEPGKRYLHRYCQSATGSNGETEWVKAPASCKFCGAPCICWCHRSASVPVPGPQGYQAATGAPGAVRVEGQCAGEAQGAADEVLGRLVRGVWTRWAREQSDPKPSWLTGWDDLDAGQREVDIRIGRAVAAAERAKVQHAIDRIAQTAAAAQEKAVGTAVAAERRRFAAVLKAIAEHCDDADFEASLDLLRAKP